VRHPLQNLKIRGTIIEVVPTETQFDPHLLAIMQFDSGETWPLAFSRTGLGSHKLSEGLRAEVQCSGAMIKRSGDTSFLAQARTSLENNGFAEVASVEFLPMGAVAASEITSIVRGPLFRNGEAALVSRLGLQHPPKTYLIMLIAPLSP